MSNKTQAQFLRIYNYISGHFLADMYSVDEIEKDISVSANLAVNRHLSESKVVFSIFFYNIRVGFYVDDFGNVRFVLDLPEYIDIRDFDINRLLSDIWKEIRKAENGNI